MLCGLTPSRLLCAPSDINKLSPFSLPVFSVMLLCLFPRLLFLFCVWSPSLTPLTHPIRYSFSLIVTWENQMSYCKISLQESQLHFSNKKLLVAKLHPRFWWQSDHKKTIPVPKGNHNLMLTQEGASTCLYNTMGQNSTEDTSIKIPRISMMGSYSMCTGETRYSLGQVIK